MRLLWIMLSMLAVHPAAFVDAKDKQALPSDIEQLAVRTRIQKLFKSDYMKTTPARSLALADKLLNAATDEKDNAAARYVMLTEAMDLSVRGNDVERAMRAARDLDQEYKAPQLKNTLAAKLAEQFGPKENVEEYRTIVGAEFAKSAEAKPQIDLARKWLEVFQTSRTDARLSMVKRARQLLSEVLANQEAKGLARAEAEQVFQDTTNEIDKLDAKAGRFTLYEGKWSVKYENKYIHEYVIAVDGSLAFDRCISPDGTAFVKKEEQRAKLQRRKDATVALFAGGKLVERFTIQGDKLLVERFDPVNLYPNKPNNKGEGTKEK